MSKCTRIYRERSIIITSMYNSSEMSPKFGGLIYRFPCRKYALLRNFGLILLPYKMHFYSWGVVLCDDQTHNYTIRDRDILISYVTIDNVTY